MLCPQVDDIDHPDRPLIASLAYFEGVPEEVCEQAFSQLDIGSIWSPISVAASSTGKRSRTRQWPVPVRLRARQAGPREARVLLHSSERTEKGDEMMMPSLTNQLGYSSSCPLLTLRNTSWIICGLGKRSALPAHWYIKRVWH